jgi:superfamily I DNA/RNA helicase
VARKGGEEASQSRDGAAQAGVPTWTDEQRKVIDAPPGSRILVSAGPGTGKTAIACARISRLVSDEHLQPHEIWLVSFTRTAVHELRQRITAFSRDASVTSGLRIATIDSHAWSIQSGFSPDAALTGSYDENIAAVIKLIKAHEGVFEYLSGVRHLFIDEAQDVIGVRCELLLELIHALPDECGVTVLADDAQSIYGFSEDDASSAIKGTLPDLIREHMKFKELPLKEIHRTNDPTLIRLFREGRGIVLKGKATGKVKLEEIREFLAETNHGALEAYSDAVETLPSDLDNAFFLFRKRGEALQASSYLKLRPHRLRMSGLPHGIHSWIATMFWDWVKPEIERSEFDKRWQARLRDQKQLDVEAAWRNLVRICGMSEHRIQVQKLASRLGRGSPPVDLSDPDFGFAGPVVGTIHGSKGREAGEVYLYLPPVSDRIDDEDAAEEARVLFVAASRARSSVRIGKGQSQVYPRKVDSGRAFTVYPYGKFRARACVEIGRAGDVDAVGLVGQNIYEDSGAAIKAQSAIAKISGRLIDASAVSGPKSISYRYGLQADGSHLCYLSRNIGYDMFEIAKQVDKIVHMKCVNPPRDLRYLRIFGTRTFAVAPEDPARETLHAPWRDSGFILAPMVLGYGMVHFRW